MSKKLNILWIDDNPSRKRDIVNVKPDFQSVRERNIQKKLKEIKDKYDAKNEAPDLIILDQVLDKIDNRGEGAEFFKSGASVSLMLREIWKKTPIVGVTAARNINLGKVTLNQKYIYDDFIEFDQFSEYEEKLLVIAKTFKKNIRICNKRDIINLLECPSDLAEQLNQILPEQLLEKDDGQLFRLYNWVNYDFFKRPGFLYDRLWVSTYLGLVPDGFRKVEGIFKNAKYKGIFANIKDERWWPIKVKKILIGQVKDTSLIYPWKMGRHLPGITKKYFSKCYKCDVDYPEIVAYTDDRKEEEDRHAMHVSCTVALEKVDKKLFFEELRKMKDD